MQTPAKAMPVDIGAAIFHYACGAPDPELFIFIYGPKHRPYPMPLMRAASRFRMPAGRTGKPKRAPGIIHCKPRYIMVKIIIFSLLSVFLCLTPPAQAKEAEKAQTISALEAAQMLNQAPKTTFMVDVRTKSQYTLLGHPPRAYNVPWKLSTGIFQVAGGPFQGGKAPFTGYQLSTKPNPDFTGVVQSLFKPTDKIIVISMQGDLGADAADALVAAGFKEVFNLRHGFSGDLLGSKDEGKLAEKYSPLYRLGGKINGWMFWGLPVSHQVDPRYVYPPDLKRMQTLK